MAVGTSKITSLSEDNCADFTKIVYQREFLKTGDFHFVIILKLFLILNSSFFKHIKSSPQALGRMSHNGLRVSEVAGSDLDER